MTTKGLAFNLDPLRPISLTNTKKWQREGNTNSYKLLDPDIETDRQTFTIGLNEVVKAIGSDRSKERIVIRGIANANVIDRAQERLDPRGCMVNDFLKNPQLLAHHSYYHPVGQVEVLDLQDDGVHFEGWVGDPTRADLTAMQLEMRSLILQNIIKTVSVGFIPKKIRAPLYNDQGDMTEPLVIEKWDLLEISLVAVPCNQGSVFGVKDFQAAEDAAKLNSKIADDSVNEKTAKEDTQEKELVSCLIFDKDKFNLSSAKEWTAKNGYAVTVELKFCDEFDADFTEEGVSKVTVKAKGTKTEEVTTTTEAAKAEDNSTENFKGEVLTILRSMSETSAKSADMIGKIYQKTCESDSSDQVDDGSGKEDEEAKETTEGETKEVTSDTKAFEERVVGIEKNIADLTASVKLLVEHLGITVTE